jgi:hypothetical protein
MRRIEIINRLDVQFGLMKLFREGIIQWTELRDRDIYLQYDIYLKMGKSLMDAKELTAEDFKVNFKTVQRAIKKMNNEEICNTPARTEGEA